MGVSVVMPAFNAEKTIRQAIQSVMSQSLQELELIIVDDCSTDSTMKIVKEWVLRDSRIIYLCNEVNSGVSFSRNRGVQAASFPWVAFLDSDDAWAPEKLERQISVMEQHPNAALCFTGSSFVDEKGTHSKYILSVPERITYDQLLKQNLISCSSVLVRTDVMRRFPMCRDRDMHEDYAVWLGILKETPCAIGIDLPLLIYRVSPESKSGNKLKAAWMQLRTYRYVGLPNWKSAYYFCHYVYRSLKKYRNIYRSTG